MINLAHWHWPQITFAVLIIIGLTRGLIKHGQDDGQVNFFGSAISALLTVMLLIEGGFFGGCS